jgi:hypothetical protein
VQKYPPGGVDLSLQVIELTGVRCQGIPFPEVGFSFQVVDFKWVICQSTQF